MLDRVYVKCKGSTENFYSRIELYFLDGLSFLINNDIKCPIKSLTIPYNPELQKGTFFSKITANFDRPVTTGRS